MKKNNQLTYFIGLFLLALFAFSSCKKDNDKSQLIIDEFNTVSSERDLIVVISDMHLGADLAYAEIYENLKPLENFLNKIKTSKNVKELVIAGDMLDEWFVPADVDTYNGKDQADFVQRIAVANKGVIDVFNSIIQDGTILVTYVPGNHDLTITEENIDLILPGINQARDDKLGLGTYSPTGYPQIAIEHGHRYNYFCAPDPYSNQDVAPGTIMPPGYFFTRIATQHVVQQCYASSNVVPVINPNAAILGNDSQKCLYTYYRLWQVVLDEWFEIENTFDEKMIVTNVNGFTDAYSVNDLLPWQEDSTGMIFVDLYAGAQDMWTERCISNKVPVPIPTIEAIGNAVNTEQTDVMAELQFFKNADSDKKIVIFGHTHVAKIMASTNLKGEKTLYANSGTWIDHKDYQEHETTMNFIIITPQTDEISSKTKVSVFNFQNEKITQMATDSLQL